SIRLDDRKCAFDAHWLFSIDPPPLSPPHIRERGSSGCRMCLKHSGCLWPLRVFNDPPPIPPPHTGGGEFRVSQRDESVPLRLSLSSCLRGDICRCYFFSSLATAAPRSAGDLTTWMPAAFIAFIFSSAVPLPPAMISPAWPMRRPGGAVWPAMKPTTGFFT